MGNQGRDNDVVADLPIFARISDVWSAVFGQKQQLGALDLIAVDRAFSLGENLGLGQ